MCSDLVLENWSLLIIEAYVLVLNAFSCSKLAFITMIFGPFIKLGFVFRSMLTGSHDFESLWFYEILGFVVRLSNLLSPHHCVRLRVPLPVFQYMQKSYQGKALQGIEHRWLEKYRRWMGHTLGSISQGRPCKICCLLSGLVQRMSLYGVVFFFLTRGKVASRWGCNLISTLVQMHHMKLMILCTLVAAKSKFLE